MSRLIVWVADKHLNELDTQPRTGILREAGFLYKASFLGYLTYRCRYYLLQNWDSLAQEVITSSVIFTLVNWSSQPPKFPFAVTILLMRMQGLFLRR